MALGGWVTMSPQSGGNYHTTGNWRREIYCSECWVTRHVWFTSNRATRFKHITTCRVTYESAKAFCQRTLAFGRSIYSLLAIRNWLSIGYNTKLLITSICHWITTSDTEGSLKSRCSHIIHRLMESLHFMLFAPSIINCCRQTTNGPDMRGRHRRSD